MRHGTRTTEEAQIHQTSRGAGYSRRPIGYESQLWQMADHTHSELTDEDMTRSLLYFLAENEKFVGHMNNPRERETG